MNISIINEEGQDTEWVKPTPVKQTLGCDTTISTEFVELFSLKRIYVKYKNAILLHIDFFSRTWKDYTHCRVLPQIFNCYGETHSQCRNN